MDDRMARAVELAGSVRGRTSPNPWVGCVLVATDGRTFEGATQPPGGPHAEAVALDSAGSAARGATAYVTLEPCSHTGRTGPCADALIEAGVARVVVGITDPDPLVGGRGIERLRSAGVEVELGLGAAEVERQLAAYLKHRRTGRPFVVLKLAATLDGRIAAPDGSSQWITGEEARADAHRLRAESDAVLVGAGTVRTDDPSLTVRLVDGAGGVGAPASARSTGLGPRAGNRQGRDPLRVVLGRAPGGANVQPAEEVSGDLGAILDDLGAKGVLQLLVEGGAHVAHQFHSAGLVDQYVIYVAPAILGGEDGRSLFAGPGAPTMAEVWRGRFTDVARLGNDVRLTVEPG